MTTLVNHTVEVDLDDFDADDLAEALGHNWEDEDIADYFGFYTDSEFEELRNERDGRIEELEDRVTELEEQLSELEGTLV